MKRLYGAKDLVFQNDTLCTRRFPQQIANLENTIIQTNKKLY